jgi:hypothetical protein
LRIFYLILLLYSACYRCCAQNSLDTLHANALLAKPKAHKLIVFGLYYDNSKPFATISECQYYDSIGRKLVSHSYRLSGDTLVSVASVCNMPVDAIITKGGKHPSFPIALYNYTLQHAVLDSTVFTYKGQVIDSIYRDFVNGQAGLIAAKGK